MEHKAGENDKAGQTGLEDVSDEAQDWAEMNRQRAFAMAGKTRAQVEQGRVRAAESAHEAAGAIRGQTYRVERVAREATEGVAGQLDAAADYLQRTPSDQIWKDAKDFVQQHPWKALAGALLAGFLAARIMR